MSNIQRTKAQDLDGDGALTTRLDLSQSLLPPLDRLANGAAGAAMNSAVMHVIPHLGVGGAERMLVSLVTAKRKNPFPQAVIEILGGGTLGPRIQDHGIPVYNLGLRHISALPVAVTRLAFFIRKLRPATIQSWLYYGDVAALCALSLSGRRKYTRLYWGLRGSSTHQAPYRLALRLSIQLCTLLSGRPDGVVANSFAGQVSHRELGYSPRAFPIIPNGIDTDVFRPNPVARRHVRAALGLAPQAPVVVHAARVDPMKDHASLIAVARAMPKVRFIAVGAGTESLVVPPNMTAYGMRPNMPEIFAAADVALSTSIFGEGFPNVVAEAMASGVPAVVTDVGDSARIVGDTGLVARPRDADAMASHVGRLLQESEPVRQRRAVLCRQRIQELFSLERAVAAFDALHLRGELPQSSDGL